MSPLSEAIAQLTLAERLRTVSYAEDADYVPSDFALQFMNFIKLVNGGEGEENKTPVIHLKMLDQIAAGDTRVANMLFRGAAKTTVLCEYMVLYIAVFGELPVLGKISLALYVSDSMDNGVKNFRKNVEFRWENSDFLRKYVPKTKFTDGRLQFENIDGHKFVVKCYGAKTGVRGTKEMGVRPQLALLDDIVSDEDARSATEIKHIETTVYNAIDNALHPMRNMVFWAGTPFNENDPLYKAVESGAWAVNVFPVCEKFPCTEEEFRGAWPDRFTYKFLKDKYDRAVLQRTLPAFYQELMLQISSDDQRLVFDSDFPRYDRARLLREKDAYNFYFTSDLAFSEKKAADFSVILVWAVNHVGQCFLVDGIHKQQLANQTWNDLFRLVTRYRPMEVGIEINGQQISLISWLYEQMTNRNIFFKLAGEPGSSQAGLRSKGTKLERFHLFHPYIQERRIMLPADLTGMEWVNELLHQFSLVTLEGIRSKKDDLIDAATMLAKLEMFWPSAPASEVGLDDSGIWLGHDTMYSSTISNYLP